MSSDLTAIKQEPVGKLAKAEGRRMLLGVPQQYKRELSPKDGLFKPAVSLQWLDGLDEGIGGSIAVAIILDAVAALFVGLPLSLGVPSAAPIFWSIYGAAQGVLLPIPGFISVPANSGYRRNFKAFVDWLNARYDIQLSSKQKLDRFLSIEDQKSRRRSFTDASGQVLTLSGSAEKGYAVFRSDASGEWIEYPRTAAAKAPQVKQQAATALPQDLKAEHEEIQRLISKLSTRELSPESDHVVNRAERDIEKVLALHGDLQELGVATEAQIDNVARVLKQLRTELTTVFQRETDWALDALSIETTYVTSREERAGIKMKK